ncbi:MAG: phosphatase PAP2 family protein [Patescibacteria group bacterium]
MPLRGGFSLGVGMNLNRQIFGFIFSYSGRSPVFDACGVFLAEYLPYFLITGIFFFVFSYKTWRKRVTVFSFLVFVPLLARGVIGYLIGFLFPVARPFVVFEFIPLVGRVPDAAFPSGHATIFFSLALALFVFNRTWGWSYFLAACAIGIARVFVGVHWPMDIIGGLLVAVVAAGISWLIFRPYLEKLVLEKQN